MTLDGQRKSFYASSSDEAEAKALDYVTTIRNIKDAKEEARKSRLFVFWLATELASVYEGKSESTKEQSSWAIAKLIDCTPDGLTIDEIRRSDLTAVWRKVTLTTPNNNSQRTVHKYFARACRLLWKDGLTPANFADDVRPPRATRRETIPSLAYCRHLWWSLRDDMLGPMVFLEVFLGLRSDEARSVKVDYLGNDGEGKPVLFVHGTKNDGADRYLYLSPAIAEILDYYASKASGGYLCPSTAGKKLQDNLTREFESRCKRLGVPYFTQHTFRHRFATETETCVGVARSVRKAIMGQSFKTEIGDWYVHPSPANMREFLTRWESYAGLDKAVRLLVERGTPRGTRNHQSCKGN